MANRDEAKVRVRLDTKQAKADLEDLGKQGAGTAGRIGSGIRGSFGLGSSMAGGAVGGFLESRARGIAGQFQGAASAGANDILGEYTNMVGAMAGKAIFGDLSPEARARSMARESTIQAFGPLGRDAHNNPSALRFFDATARLNMPKELGRQGFEADTRFAGVTAETAKEQGTKIAGEVKSGFDRIIETLQQMVQMSGGW